MGSVMMVISFETEMQKTHYNWRPLWQMEYCPGFTMAGKIGRRMGRQTSVASLPLFAKYARVRLSEIPMSKLLIKLKEPENRVHLKHLKDAMQNSMEEDGLKDCFTIWSYIDVLDNASNVSNFRP